MPDCKYELVGSILTRVYFCVYARAYVTLLVIPVGLLSVNQCWFAKLLTVALGDLENACCLAYETFSVKMRLFTMFVYFEIGVGDIFLN